MIRDLDPGMHRVCTGACIGFDAAVALYMYELGFQVHTVVPGRIGMVDPFWRTRCHSYEEMPRGSEFRDRNLRLADIGIALYAAPEWPEHNPLSQRSGTWQTVRMFRNAGKPAYVYVLNY